jgi:hypothetical protein
LTGFRVVEEGVEAGPGEATAQEIARRNTILNFIFDRTALPGSSAEMVVHKAASSFFLLCIPDAGETTFDGGPAARRCNHEGSLAVPQAFVYRVDTLSAIRAL